MSSVFKELSDFLPANSEYSLLPFRFIRLDTRRYVAINEVGEWQVIERSALESFVRGRLPPQTDLYNSLKSKHFVQDEDSKVAPDLLTLKIRTKRDRIAD